jgi:protein TonB
MHTAAFPSLRECSPQRIGAWSAALALHGLAFALLVMPPSALLPEVRQEPTANPTLVELKRAVEPKPAPPIPTPPKLRPRPTPTPRTAVVPTPIVEEAAWAEPVEVDLEPTLEPAGDPAPVGLTQGAQIAYDHAPPPPYPRLAHRRGWEGDVLLRVHVGSDGRPRKVDVERSSGRRELDRGAAEHVLAKWRFQPALQGGRAVEAWALVPISFRIERG